MGKIDTFGRVLSLLDAACPRATSAQRTQYAGLFITYRECALNIARCGTITAHPRTGAPLENPYLRVRGSTIKAMAEIPRIKSEVLWLALALELAEIDAAPKPVAKPAAEKVTK